MEAVELQLVSLLLDLPAACSYQICRTCTAGSILNVLWVLNIQRFGLLPSFFISLRKVCLGNRPKHWMFE